MRPKVLRWRSIRSRPTVTMAAMAAVAVITAGLLPPGAATASPTTARCDQPLLLVHDTARGDDSMRSLKRVLEQQGWCPHTLEYGTTPVTDALATAGSPTVAGLTSLAAGADELGRALLDLPAGPVTVVGHGAGSLIAQYQLQNQADLEGPSGTDRQHLITKIITVGPIWRGTDVLFLGTTEELSRQLGTYDAVLQLERPIIDPICEGCRDLIAGSDFLRDLHSRPFPTPGVHYRNIITPTDTLVEPAMSAAVDGMDNIVLRGNRFGATPDHFSMIDDVRVHEAVAAGLATT